MDPKLVKERQRIAELLAKTIRKTVTPEEKTELEKWIGDREDRKNIVQILTTQSPDTMEKAVKQYSELINHVLGKSKK
jgi:hypothetical protein